MKRVIRMISMLAVVAFAGSAHAAGTAPAAAAAPAGGALQKDLAGAIGYASMHVMQLEEAFPQNKFNWRPAPGVRSVAEAFMHIAFANYGMIKMASGKEPPAEAGFEMNPAKWDKKTTDKAEIKKILEQSFAHVQAVLPTIPDSDLDKKVDFFGMQLNVRSVLLALVGHVNEHLGQEVAYARTNKIVPPWSKHEMHEGKKAAADEKNAPTEKKAPADKAAAPTEKKAPADKK
jgi:uncharacterized damage-inducible protein DinB